MADFKDYPGEVVRGAGPLTGAVSGVADLGYDPAMGILYYKNAAGNWAAFSAGASNDFWRTPSISGGGLPDGTNDPTESIVRTGDVGIGLTGATTPIVGTLDINKVLVTRRVSLPNINANGALATAAASVDLSSYLMVQPQNPGFVVTLPTPTDTTAGRHLWLHNVSGFWSFVVDLAPYDVVVKAGGTVHFLWNGSRWMFDEGAPGGIVTIPNIAANGALAASVDTGDVFLVTQTSGSLDPATARQVSLPGSSSGYFYPGRRITVVNALASSQMLIVNIGTGGSGVEPNGNALLYPGMAADFVQVGSSGTPDNTSSGVSWMRLGGAQVVHRTGLAIPFGSSNIVHNMNLLNNPGRVMVEFRSSAGASLDSQIAVTAYAANQITVNNSGLPLTGVTVKFFG